MRKYITILHITITLIFLIILICSSHPAACQPQRSHVKINQTQTDKIYLENTTLLVEVSINLTSIAIKNPIDDVKLIILVPKFLEKRVTIETFSYRIKDDTIIFEKTVASNVNLTEQKIFQDKFVVKFSNITCELISEIQLKNYFMQLFIELKRNEIYETYINLEIDQRRLCYDCFQKFIDLKNIVGRWIDGNLNISLTISFNTKCKPSGNLVFTANGYAIENCSPKAICAVKNGVAVIDVSKITNGDIHFTVLFSKENSIEILKDKKLVLSVKFDEKEIVKTILKADITFEGLSFNESTLYLYLKNRGNLPFNISKYSFEHPTNVIIKELDIPTEEKIINPNVSVELRNNIVIKNDKDLSNNLRIKFDMTDNIYKEIVFNIELEESLVQLVRSDEVVVSMKISTSNSSLRLYIPKDYPLRINIEGLAIRNCTSNEIICEVRDDGAIAYGNVTLPANIILRLSVRDKGGPENRSVTIFLSEKLQSQTTVRIQGQKQEILRPGRDMLLFLGLAVSVAITIVASVVILSKRRVSRVPAKAPEEEVEEPFFDFG